MSQIDRSMGLVGNVAMKAPVRLASTANVATLNGLLTIDGVVTAQDDRVLLTAQASGVDNGIYVADTGDWERAQDCDGTLDLVYGTLVKVNAGAVNQGFWYVSTTTDPIIVGSTSIAFALASTVLAVVSPFMQTVLDDLTALAARATLGVVALASSSGMLYGATLSNNVADATNDIDVAAGVAMDSTNAVLITIATMAGKRLDANWAPGAATGMRNSAVAITNTTYHIYAVAKADGTQDIYAHTSTVIATVLAALQIETGGALYIYARRIGSIIRSGATILPFTQLGDEFLLLTPAADYAAANPGAAAVTRALTVPLGIQVTAIHTFSLFSTTADTATYYAYLSSLDQTDVAAGATAFTIRTAAKSTAGDDESDSAVVRIRTSTAASVRTRLNASTASEILTGITHGWIDTRGRT